MSDIHVNIGELKTGNEGDVLKTTLGSCVGIALYWPEKKKGALAHCLLPEGQFDLKVIGAKYVTQAVPSLLIKMKIIPEDADKIIVTIVGGANMMYQLSTKNLSQIGTLNIDMAKNLIEAAGLKISRLDVGGNCGRKMLFDCTTGNIEVIKLIEEEAEVHNGRSKISKKIDRDF